MKPTDKFKLGVLLDYLFDLFEKTERLYSVTVDAPSNPSPIVSAYLAEIFTICETAKLYVAINDDLGHYEISSLFSFWGRAYFQLKDVIEKQDTNTSWLYSEFNNYKGQHDIVIQMLKGVS